MVDQRATKLIAMTPVDECATMPATIMPTPVETARAASVRTARARRRSGIRSKLYRRQSPMNGALAREAAWSDRQGPGEFPIHGLLNEGY
jgi:hypothetical protein